MAILKDVRGKIWRPLFINHTCPASDLEDEAKAGEDGKGRPKRGQGVQTKAYKEPKRGEQGGKTAAKAEAPPPPAKIGAKEVRKTVRPVKTVSKPVKAGFRSGH